MRGPSSEPDSRSCAPRHRPSSGRPAAPHARSGSHSPRAVSASTADGAAPTPGRTSRSTPSSPSGLADEARVGADRLERPQDGSGVSGSEVDDRDHRSVPLLLGTASSTVGQPGIGLPRLAQRPRQRLRAALDQVVRAARLAHLEMDRCARLARQRLDEVRPQLEPDVRRRQRIGPRLDVGVRPSPEVDRAQGQGLVHRQPHVAVASDPERARRALCRSRGRGRAPCPPRCGARRPARRRWRGPRGR